MKKNIFILFLWCTCIVVHGQIKVEELRCENRVNPVGVDILQPSFSWQLSGEYRGIVQSAYEIKVLLDKNVVWNSGVVKSEQSVHVPYTGPALISGKKYTWMVKVWDRKEKASTWSKEASWQMGLLKASDWKAKWIQIGLDEDPIDLSPLFRKEFTITKKIKSATAFITAYGLYEAEINGKRVGNACLTPGWTSFEKRLQYQMYDVTELIKTGGNAVGITLGNGWYRGGVGLGTKPSLQKKRSLLCQLQLNYTDGSSDFIISDDSWKASTGPILYSEIYHGEIYDARLEKNGWSVAGYDDSKWGSVKIANKTYDNLIATYNEPVRKHETFKPVKVIQTPKGETVLDFGQNLVGWVKVKVTGKAGNKIKIYHGEVLDKEGNFYNGNLRNAKQQATYLLKGNTEETFEPHFVFYGFRYIKIEGYPGRINPENFIATALYSDMEETGTFSCSNELVNQLQHNIQWSQKGNFIDVPTDCPQRDERLGWIGDAQVFSRTATFNMNVDNFFTKWLKDLKADQNDEGVVPSIIPNMFRVVTPSSGWADAATIIPWNLYLAYGDKSILKDQYESMKAWVNYMKQKSKNNLFTIRQQYGDWLFYSPSPDDFGMAAVTDKDLISQCFYAHSTQLLINAANVLGNKEDASTYSELLKNIKNAFMEEYVTPTGQLVSNTQTAYVLALNFDMFPEILRPQASERLVNNINKYGNVLTTGFLGTPYLTNVLSRFGHTDVAYKLLLQTTYPSWLYSVTKGATTIWERWDGIKLDGTFPITQMNSFNHYSYGAIGDWLYRFVTGINTYEEFPGYKKIKIKPYPGGGFTYAKAELLTYYGNVRSHWRAEKGNIFIDVVIPANTTAMIYIPGTESNTITESGKSISLVKEIEVVGREEGYTVLKVGSGKYLFSNTFSQ